MTNLESAAECLPCLPGNYCRFVKLHLTTGEVGLPTHTKSVPCSKTYNWAEQWPIYFQPCWKIPPQKELKTDCSTIADALLSEQAPYIKSQKCMNWGKKKKNTSWLYLSNVKGFKTSLLFGRGGMISSECLAGYWCKSGSSNNLINRTIEFQNCSANEDCSGLCPKGHYCPQGVDLPLPCPEHTYRDTEGAETPDQCAPCPAGFYCPSGNDWQLLLLMTVKFNISNWITNKILNLR